MHTLNRRTLAFAVSLSLLAGCVDAIGFLQLGGLFVSFMSGNSTKFAIGLQYGDWQTVGTLMMIIGCFIAGAAIGAAIRNHATKHKSVSVLTLVAVLLLIAALCDSAGVTFPAMLISTLAMGAENSILQSDGDHVIGVTYMTGTLVRIGQRITHALQGGAKFSWVPYLLLWLGLIAGGVIGAFLYMRFGFNALWFPGGWAALLAVRHWH